jgi:hypothetical protein
MPVSDFYFTDRVLYQLSNKPSKNGYCVRRGAIICLRFFFGFVPLKKENKQTLYRRSKKVIHRGCLCLLSFTIFTLKIFRRLKPRMKSRVFEVIYKRFAVTYKKFAVKKNLTYKRFAVTYKKFAVKSVDLQEICRDGP